MAISYVVAGPMVAWLGAKGVYIVGGLVAFVGVAILPPVLGLARSVAAPRGQFPVEARQALVEPAPSILP
jgi:hypothetical protein